MLVLAPGLFSMMTGWPTFAESAWPSVRATTSTAPPGGKPTRMRIGFDGYGSAAWAMPAAAASAPARRRKVFMGNPGFAPIRRDDNLPDFHGAAHACARRG